MLIVFYDGGCGLCAACRAWLSAQPQWEPLRFVAYQSAEARQLCPRLEEFDPAREIVVMADGGQIYTGGAAWVMCLWALPAYREWAIRLAHPRLLPLAKKFCHLVSENRLRLSQLLRLRPVDAEIELRRAPDPQLNCPLPGSEIP